MATANSEISYIAAVKACACGRPVLVTDRCGKPEVINGQARLVVPYDEEQMPKALLHILEGDKLRLEFGEKDKLLLREEFNGRERQSKWSNYI